MNVLKIKELATDRISKGFPLLLELDFINKDDLVEGEFVKLVDRHNRFVAYGYIGKERKTIGYVLSLNESDQIDEAFFSKLFKAAYDRRTAFYADDQTTAFRFFNGEGDGIGGLTIDYYEGYYVFSWYSEGIYQHKDMIIQAFKQVISDFKGIYEKYRYPKAPHKSRFIEGEKAVEPLVVKENGIRYNIYLDEGWMTGLFLDQRSVRRKIMESWGLGKTFLNAFSYTGAFSIAAAMGGAVKTVNVDVANRSKERTKEQFQVNGLDSEQHEIRVMDVFSYLDYAQKHRLVFDLIVLDPPTFARTKKRTFSVDKDYTELVKEAVKVLAPGGLIITSTNAWNVTRDGFFEDVNQAFEELNVDAYLLEEFDLPEDFPVNKHHPESDYLKVFALERAK
ncbi:class I SAM-dependent rRNA methyltransferase [Alkalibacterium kapii]|uniref:SAM-dependent methyltransferase n=1 Tax=Alkalibacterium kapii TaxID=426704 RepID=A0A511AXQ0_9LACT|nr:class I SAM-dependent rRNA methyltransferase [Alkalibacterium kapii]GEK90397.1 SAM-dependent methyltransferase [Alkalibacterium kapii]